MQHTLIVTPLQEEHDALFNNLTATGLNPYTDQIGKLPVQRFSELNTTLARGGHGKTQFGIQTQHLLDHETFDLVLCAGAAGALHPNVQVGDVIVAVSTFEHDYNLKFAKRPNPQFEGHPESIEQLRGLDLEAGFKVHFGVMASGDEDVIEIERGRELRAMSDALGTAWEGVGGARACKFSGIPYLELRGATDTANHEAPVVFDENVKLAMKNIAHVLVNWLARSG